MNDSVEARYYYTIWFEISVTVVNIYRKQFSKLCVSILHLNFNCIDKYPCVATASLTSISHIVSFYMHRLVLFLLSLFSWASINHSYCLIRHPLLKSKHSTAHMWNFGVATLRQKMLTRIFKCQYASPIGCWEIKHVINCMGGMPPRRCLLGKRCLPNTPLHLCI
jgi:hypothetical protein